MIGNRSDSSARVSRASTRFRLSNEGSIFRTAYVTKLGDRIVVLHRWQKKARATARADKDPIVARYREAKEKLA